MIQPEGKTDTSRKEKHGAGVVAALHMLDTFASVGVTVFDLTHLNIDGEKRGFRANQSLQQIRTSMPFLLNSAPHRQNNVIVRPNPPAAVLLVQLDDLDSVAIERVRPVSFLILETSPGNFQAWIAIAGDLSSELARRVRKGAGADPTASGATRVAGTANFKRKYEPGFPTVAIAAAQPGKIVTAAELDTLGLVAPEPVKATSGATQPLTNRARGKWPSYRYCLDRAPVAHEQDRPDVSRADFTWCMTAIDWGWSIEHTAARLLEESMKARENGQRYATETACRLSAGMGASAHPISRPSGKASPRTMGTPPNHDQTGPDISRADFTWCLTAADWGWTVEAIAERLMQESSKAQENGENYALLTAQNAAAAVERRRGRA